MTNDKILKTAAILLLATTVPFVGWGASRAQDDDDADVAMQPAESDAIAEAGPEGDSKFRDPEFRQALIKHHEKMFFERVNATPDQQAKISKIFADARESKKPLREQLHQQRKQMHELLANADATNQQITDKAHELRQTEDALKDHRLDTMLKIRAVLTPQQREALRRRYHGGDDSCCEEDMHSKHMTMKHAGGSD